MYDIFFISLLSNHLCSNIHTQILVYVYDYSFQPISLINYFIQIIKTAQYAYEQRDSLSDL